MLEVTQKIEPIANQAIGSIFYELIGGEALIT